MTFYPIFLNLSGKRVVVVGGGEVAERKVQALLECGASLKVVSPRVTPRLQALADLKVVELCQRSYQHGDCEGALLVLSATDDPVVNEAVWKDARAAGILVNTADEPNHCDFIMPAVVRQGDLTVAISTGGKSPAMAARLRQKISRMLGPEYARLLEILSQVRPEIRRRFEDARQRKDLHYSIVDSDILRLIRNRDDQAVQQRLRGIIEEFDGGEKV